MDDAAADGISLARRNSGGGAVFHDKGNINFSIISTFDENALNSYDEFLDPVIDIYTCCILCMFLRQSVIRAI